MDVPHSDETPHQLYFQISINLHSIFIMHCHFFIIIIEHIGFPYNPFHIFYQSYSFIISEYLFFLH
jgi:hypothetical protein